MLHKTSHKWLANNLSENLVKIVDDCVGGHIFQSTLFIFFFSDSDIVDGGGMFTITVF